MIGSPSGSPTRLNSLATPSEQPLHRALGLTDGELERIRGLLEREPNHFELAVFSLLWCEHCGYKHSRPAAEAAALDRRARAAGAGRERRCDRPRRGARRSRSRSRATTTPPRSSRSRARRRASAASCATSSPWARGRSRCSTGCASARRTAISTAPWPGSAPTETRSVSRPSAARSSSTPSTRDNCLVNAMCVGLLPAERVTRAGATTVGNVLVALRRHDRPRRHRRRERAREPGARRGRRGEATLGADRRPLHGQAADRGLARTRRARPRRVAPGLRRRRARVVAGRDGARRGRCRRPPRPGAAARARHGALGDHDLREPGADGRRRLGRSGSRTSPR